MALFAVIGQGSAFAQEAKTTNVQKLDQANLDARKQRVQEIRLLVESLAVKALPMSGEKVAPVIEIAKEPALLYADNVRQVATSALWVCLSEHHPIGLVAVEINEAGTRKTFEFSSLARTRMQIETETGKWSSKGSAFVFQPFPGSKDDDVAGSRPLRLQQMKRLAERFLAVEQHAREGRIELRRLISPIYRHDEMASHDGAIFVFANGTNPEIALWLTAVGPEGQQRWNYGLAALSGEQLSVSLDQREVWSEERFRGTSSTYVNGHFPGSLRNDDDK